MSEESSLLAPSFLRRLEQLEVRCRRLVRGTYPGGRRSRLLGQSIEFADYREYTPGDDIRQIDWYVYARTHKWFLKTFLDERELTVSLYIDMSRSMAFGTPEKGRRALEIAAALGYIALNRMDQVQVFAFHENVRQVLPLIRGKRNAPLLLSSLAQLRFTGAGHMQRALSQPSAWPRTPGLAIVLTDGWSEGGYAEPLACLQGMRQQVTLVQVTTEEERRPNYQGDLRLIDSETSGYTEVAVTPQLLKQYRQTYEAYTKGLRKWCFRRGIGYIPVAVEEPLESVVFTLFKQVGLVRG